MIPVFLGILGEAAAETAVVVTLHAAIPETEVELVPLGIGRAEVP
ncbi:hypothetical protein [Nesterenkonia sp. HG001]|nr:hypothetical protein [Nesterenkonia sp. HG001]MDZ5077840.1 hypothetical protein [Nesterenkonia sp. HG001]